MNSRGNIYAGMLGTLVLGTFASMLVVNSGNRAQDSRHLQMIYDADLELSVMEDQINQIVTNSEVCSQAFKNDQDEIASFGGVNQPADENLLVELEHLSIGQSKVVTNNMYGMLDVTSIRLVETDLALREEIGQNTQYSAEIQVEVAKPQFKTELTIPVQIVANTQDGTIESCHSKKTNIMDWQPCNPGDSIIFKNGVVSCTPYNVLRNYSFIPLTCNNLSPTLEPQFQVSPTGQKCAFGTVQIADLTMNPQPLPSSSPVPTPDPQNQATWGQEIHRFTYTANSNGNLKIQANLPIWVHLQQNAQKEVFQGAIYGLMVQHHQATPDQVVASEILLDVPTKYVSSGVDHGIGGSDLSDTGVVTASIQGIQKNQVYEFSLRVAIPSAAATDINNPSLAIVGTSRLNRYLADASIEFFEYE